MKNLFFFFFLVGFTHPLLALDFFFDYSCLNVPNGESYVETYIAIPANSLNLEKHPDFTLSGAAEITITFSQEDEIKQFDKYLLKSPSLTDSTVNNTQLLDTKRFALSPGTYLVELSLMDTRIDTLPVTYSETVVVEEFIENKPILSTITLLDNYQTVETENGFTKNGIEMLPRVFPFYGDKTPILKFYCEAYYTDQLDSENHLLNYYVAKKGGERVIQNKRRFKKQKGETVNVIFGELDVSDLKSGNYDLVVELKNQKNELISARRKTFQRYNKNAQSLANNPEDLEDIMVQNTFVQGLTLEELDLYVGALEPFVSSQQGDLIYSLLDDANETTLKKYLYNFWTASGSADPEGDFIDFVRQVNVVEERYGTSRTRGYKTDRGWTYLKYGKPNEINLRGRSDPGSFPYEVWEYYQVSNGQRNVQFIFYNNDLASDEFILLHSDVRGEIQEPRWQQILYRQVDADDFNDIDRGNGNGVRKYGSGF